MPRPSWARLAMASARRERGRPPRHRCRAPRAPLPGRELQVRRDQLARTVQRIGAQFRHLPLRDPPNEVVLYALETVAGVVDECPAECRGIALHAEFSAADAELVGLHVLNHRRARHAVKGRILDRCGVIRLAPVTRLLQRIRLAFTGCALLAASHHLGGALARGCGLARICRCC